MSKIVARTLDFIELFAKEKRPLTLSEIKRLLGIPFSSCHDVLQELQTRGYLYETGPRAGFYPTARLHNLSKIIVQHDPMLERAEILLKALRDELDESVSLAKAGDLKATYLLVFEPSHPLRFLLTAGDDVISLYATSTGKAMLASLPPNKLNAFLRQTKLKPLTRATLTSKVALRSDIEKSNKRGWFINREESIEDVTTISARFLWSGSVYIVTIAGPTTRMEAKLDNAAKRLVETCRALEADR